MATPEDYIGQLGTFRAADACIKKVGKDSKAFLDCLGEHVEQRKKKFMNPSSADSKDFYNFAFVDYNLKECVKKAGANHDKAQKCHEDYQKALDKLKSKKH